jgi:hypothetical protein
MATSEYRVTLGSKKKKVKQVKHVLTLDEYDELTMENQILGAKLERGNIVAELQRRADQLREFSDKSDFVDGRDVFAQQARGMEMAIRFIGGVREYEDNVGCPECEAGW